MPRASVSPLTPGPLPYSVTSLHVPDFSIRFREVSTLRYLSSITTIATCESPKLTIFGVAALLSPLARTLALRCVAHALLAPRSTRSKSGPARKAGRASRIVISGAPGESPPPLPTRGLRAEPTKLHLDPLPSRYAPSPVCRSR